MPVQFTIDLRATLDACSWRITPTAKALGIEVSQVYAVLQRAGLRDEYFARRATRPACGACGCRRATVGRADGLCGDCRREASVTRCSVTTPRPCDWCGAPTTWGAPRAPACAPGTGCAVPRRRTA